ncbi:MAG: carboxylating nicotinate-nucleotide diphosphorylase [Bacteroidales bacterium]|nr:carboxylating nicotinate-nucleotide diphosphorylase [Bacteroidales bacterium]
MTNNELDGFILQAIKEDIGDGDHTSLACIPAGVVGKMHLLVKQNGIIAGVEIAKKIIQHFDSQAKITTYIEDGASVKKGDLAFDVIGKVQQLLQAERLLLNVMQRMSGIATQTSEYAKLMFGTETKILDTRKTTPLNRFLEKEAVRIGGGYNHRFGLYDMVMIKDNHVDFSGGIGNAVKKTLHYLKSINKTLKIEVEVRNFAELEEAINTEGVDRIMLDNFSVEDTYTAVQMVAGKVELESSGGINLKTISQYAQTGVDFISVGALTHQIQSLDLSFKAVEYIK